MIYWSQLSHTCRNFFLICSRPIRRQDQLRETEPRRLRVTIERPRGHGAVHADGDGGLGGVGVGGVGGGGVGGARARSAYVGQMSSPPPEDLGFLTDERATHDPRRTRSFPRTCANLPYSPVYRAHLFIPKCRFKQVVRLIKGCD